MLTHLKKHDNLENALLWQDMPKTFCSGMSGNKYIITQGVTTSMEKNRIRPIPTGKSMRMSYQRQKEVLEMPNLIEVQKDSYDWFLRSGLKEVFDDISPISDYGGRLSLEFVDFTLCEDDVKYSIEECKQRDATYAAPLKVKVRLYNKEKDEITEHEIFMGDLPLMTATGTFVINGAERVIVSQLVRSPGIYYGIAHDKLGKRLFSCTVIPNRGAWLEYETDSNDVFYVRVDRTRKVPITVLIRALGVSSNAEIVELFGEEPKILASFTKDTSTNYQEGLLELYKKIRPGEPLAVENAESLIMSMFFDPRRYDLAKVGRYKFNKKLALRSRIRNQILAEDVVDPSTGEILAEKGTTVTLELADKIQNAAVPYVWIQTEERNVKVLSNLMVDLKAWVDVDEEELGIKEKVYYPVLEKILEENTDIEEIKQAIKRDIHDLIPKHITKEDIFASINYNMHLEYGAGNADDIDHLGNRRIRAVGELLQNQYRIGLSRMERVVRERMTTQDIDGISPQSLINIKPVTAAIKEFFGSSQLSQFMDQNNPLGELTHKRRLSALGPGGLSRDRAGFEVRDVHYSHYGRMCPIETPEGPNIGLINSLASYARINEYGFVEAPYRRIDKSDPKNPRVTDEVVYMTADEEDNYHVAQANEPLDEEGHFIHKNVSGRFREDLLYRLNTIHLELPPLRERGDDILLFIDYFIRRYANKYGRKDIFLHENALEKLRSYHWPGNIRELQHSVEKAIILCEGNVIRPKDIFVKQTWSPQLSTVVPNLEEVERQAIETAIRQNDGNLTATAEQLGISRQTLYNKIKRFKL